MTYNNIFILIVATSLSLLSVNAKIPSYIKTCNRDDPNLGKCIENSIAELRDKLTQGIPELGVPSIIKLKFDEVDLELGPGLKTEIREVTLDGLENYIFNKVEANMKADSFNFDVSFPELIARGNYEIDAAIGSIPLKGKGPIYFQPKSVTGKGTLFGKRVVRNGITYYYFQKIDLKLIISDYKINLANLFDGEPTIGKATNKLLNEEKDEVMASILPGLEKAVSEKILFIANNICKHFTFDELFPES